MFNLRFIMHKKFNNFNNFYVEIQFQLIFVNDLTIYVYPHIESLNNN